MMAATRLHRIRGSVGLTNADWIRDFTELRRNSSLVRTVTSADPVRVTVVRGVQVRSSAAFGAMLSPLPFKRAVRAQRLL
jgi:hypothetical protein